MLLELPISEAVPTGYMRHRLTFTLDGVQQVTARQILVGLKAENATLANGKVVVSEADATKWLLERAAGGQTFVVPAVGDVRLGTEYGEAGEFVGELPVE